MTTFEVGFFRYFAVLCASSFEGIWYFLELCGLSGNNCVRFVGKSTGDVTSGLQPQATNVLVRR